MARVTRGAYAEAFEAVARRPLIQLPQMAGRSESEIFFDALALNGVDVRADLEAERLLEPFSAHLAAALAARQEDLAARGQLLPGAAEAMAAVAKLDGVTATVLTGNSRPAAMVKLRAFGLDGFVDFDIGGYGSEAYPKGTLLRVARQRAADARGVTFGEDATVYVADSRATWTRRGSAGPGHWRWPAAGPARPSCGTRGPTRCCPTWPTRPGSSPCSPGSRGA